MTIFRALADVCLAVHCIDIDFLVDLHDLLVDLLVTVDLPATVGLLIDPLVAVDFHKG